MSDTPSTPSHGKKFRWRKSYLLLVPLLLLGMVELFVDPFPRSIWALRVLTTKYLVHVRADLTIDGEPLVMDRTIRCFNPVDFFWYPGAPPRGDVRASNGQAGDTLAAVTSKGRLFAINVPDACGALGSRLDADGQGYTWTDPATNDVTPLYLSQNEIETPVLYEIHGGRHPEQIDAYIARDLLRQGYHGVKLDELVVEKTGGLLLKDWNGYEWFGRGNWHRRLLGNSGLYQVVFLKSAPESRWQEMETNLNRLDYPQNWLAGFARTIDTFRKVESSTVFTTEQITPNPYLQYFQHSRLIDAGLLLRLAADQNQDAHYQWLAHEIIPCLPTGQRKSFTCLPEKKGTLAYTEYEADILPMTVTVNGFSFQAKSSDIYLVTAPPRVMYATDFGSPQMTGR